MLSLLYDCLQSLYLVNILMFLFFQRPIAGRVNFCPISIADNEGDDDYIMAVATHEILHALVSKSWLDYLINTRVYIYRKRWHFRCGLIFSGKQHPLKLNPQKFVETKK